MTDARSGGGLLGTEGLSIQDASLGQIVKLLESTKWTDNLSAKEIQALSHYVYVCIAEKGTVIFSEGARDVYMCLLVDGSVSIVKQGKHMASSGAGRIVGEMSLIDGEPRSASVIAEERTVMIILTGKGFERLSSENPRLAIKVLLKISKLISQRLRQTSGALVGYLGE